LDVTNLVRDHIINPGSSFGYLLKLKTETPFRLLTFASSDHPNPALHPKLEICYTTTLTTNTELLQENKVDVFPNPTNGIVNVVFNNTTNTYSISRFQVFDTTGKKVFEELHTNQSSLSFDISGLQGGINYWVITNDQISSKGKLILTK
jgi:hypothetical protein